MSYQALYRAWRPDTFSQMCGQEAIVRTLRRQVETGRIAHAYLFCGTRGTGKTTAAKVLSRAVNCLEPVNGDPCGKCACCLALARENAFDVMEIDAASNNGVDEIRELRDNIKYPPAVTRYKVYIIDEVHMLSTGAFNALLKTLEEPPAHAVFILATTEPHKLPATVLSRCQRFDFHRISMEDIIGRLRVVLNGIGRSASEEALCEIARAAEGAMRDALSLLDVCLSFTEGEVTAELARDVLGTTGRDFMFEFTDALLDFDAAAALEKIDAAMRRGSDPRVFALDTAAHLRAVLLAGISGTGIVNLMEITPEDAQRFIDQSNHADRSRLMRLTELFMHIESELKWISQPRTLLELAAVRACHPEQEKDAAMEERIARVEKLIERGALPAASEKPAPQKKTAPAAPEKKAAPVVAAPAEKPPQQYLDALEKIGQAEPSVRKMLSEMHFAGLADGVLSVEFESRHIIALRLLEGKKDTINRVLTECFGAPTTIRMVTAGAAAPKASSAARDVIRQSYDIFGRDKIELTD